MESWIIRQKTNQKSIVCFAFGSFSADLLKFYKPLLQALQKKDVSVLAHNDKEEFETDNQFLFKHKYVKYFPDLFEHCDTVVHLGGAGTCVEIMYSGKAQIILYTNIGQDKEANAMALDVNEVRECSKVLNPTQVTLGSDYCEPLARKLDRKINSKSPEDVADAIADAIVAAPKVQEKQKAHFQELVRHELGAISTSSSLALTKVIDVYKEVWRQWDENPELLVKVPIVIYLEKDVPNAKEMATAVCKTYPAMRIFVVSAEDPLLPETNLKWFASAGALQDHFSTGVLHGKLLRPFEKVVVIHTQFKLADEDLPHGERLHYTLNIRFTGAKGNFHAMLQMIGEFITQAAKLGEVEY